MKILDSLFNSIPMARNASASPRGTDKTEKVPASGLDAASEPSGIVADLKAQGYVISAEEADRISEFIESAEGTESEKLQTVKTALDKGLPLTARSLQSVRAALFEPVLPPELERLPADSAAAVSDEWADLLQAFARLSTGKTESGSASANEEQMTQWLMKALEHVSALSESFIPSSSESECADCQKDSRKTISEADIMGLHNADQPTESSLKEAVDHMISGLRQQETESSEAGPASMPPEALIQGISLLMKEITPRMAAVKTEFELLRKTMTTELTAVSHELVNPAPANMEKAVEKLSHTIEKLDHAILKSDIPLYTSMVTEKKLLNWSSELQEARRLVSDGQSEKAAEIVNRITLGVQEIQFQPARLKVIHRTLQQGFSGNELTDISLQQRAHQQINRILEPIQSPREVLEAFKALGLTHESEVVSTMGQAQKKQKEDWHPQGNLKEILMRLAADTQEKLTTVTGTERSLNNLTGQQLLSRPDGRLQSQTLFFSLPMEMANRVEDLKIYIQSRKNSGKVDWENCTFYFAVHTEKFGDVGIRFTAAQKSVSIQVKCDNQSLRKAVGPLVEDFKQAMLEAGYRIAGITYSPLKEIKTSSLKDDAPTEATGERKGLNLKV